MLKRVFTQPTAEEKFLPYLVVWRQFLAGGVSYIMCSFESCCRLYRNK